MSLGEAKFQAALSVHLGGGVEVERGEQDLGKAEIIAEARFENGVGL